MRKGDNYPQKRRKKGGIGWALKTDCGMPLKSNQIKKNDHQKYFLKSTQVTYGRRRRSYQTCLPRLLRIIPTWIYRDPTILLLPISLCPLTFNRFYSYPRRRVPLPANIDHPAHAVFSGIFSFLSLPFLLFYSSLCRPWTLIIVINIITNT